MMAATMASDPDRLYELVTRLYPICRSITGDGVRETLRELATRVPLAVHEVPTGTSVLDWVVPKEWNVREAWIAGPDGVRVVDFEDSNLHLVSYSIPVRARMPLAELLPHLHSLPDTPELIPYRTSYYREDWGFCLADSLLRQLPEGEYEVCIDTTLADGSLSYGELIVPGATDDEILVSAHVCHPALANDNLSGVAVAVGLAERLLSAPRRHTFRFVFAPGTIGAVTWLARNADVLPRIVGGFVLTGIGDQGPLTYKRSRRGAAAIDRAFVSALEQLPHKVIPFSPVGYDERQFGSQGFDLPVGCLMRTPFGEYPEYHTSADDLSFVSAEQLAESLALCLDVVDRLEGNIAFVNTSPLGEPQFARHGVSGGDALRDAARKWLLNLSDGSIDLLAISERSRVAFDELVRAAAELEAAGLLARR
jgi:aminopeptidase-like protein